MTFTIIHIDFPKTSMGTSSPMTIRIKMEWVATLCQQLNYTIAQKSWFKVHTIRILIYGNLRLYINVAI